MFIILYYIYYNYNKQILDHMLAKIFGSRSLTAIITYSMQLQKQPVAHHFAKNFKLARQQITKIGTQFEMSKNQSRRLFHFYPAVFKPNSKQYKQFQQRINWINQLNDQRNQKGLRDILQKLKFQTNYLAFQFTKNNFDQLVQTVNKYFTNKQQIQTILTKCPNLINPKFKQIVQQKLDIMQNYVSLNHNQAMQVFQKSPFLLCFSPRKFKQSIVSLFRTYNLSKQQIVEQMKTTGQIFLLGGQTLDDIYKLPIKWGLTNEQAKNLFLNNPVLYFNYPYDVMPFKRRIFRFLRFTQQMARNMLINHPQILACSIRSLQQKALFITNRLALKMDNKIVQLLAFNFNGKLRPRGQILVKSKTVYNNDNIVGFMKMTDQQFMDKLSVPIEKLNQQKAKYPISIQMDFRRGGILQKVGARQKIIRLAQAYQH